MYFAQFLLTEAFVLYQSGVGRQFLMEKNIRECKFLQWVTNICFFVPSSNRYFWLWFRQLFDIFRYETVWGSHSCSWWFSIFLCNIYLWTAATNRKQNHYSIYARKMRQTLFFFSRIEANDGDWNSVLINTEPEMLNCYKLWYKFFFH